MSIDQLSSQLLRLEIFQDLTPLHVTEIARRAERVIFRPGQALITDGEAGDAAVLAIAGEAVRTSGPGIVEEEAVEEGSLLGEMAMLIDTDYSSTVVARTPVKALRIARQDMLEMMGSDPALAEHFLHKMSDRLHRLAAHMRDIEETLAGSLETESRPPELMSALDSQAAAESREHADGEPDSAVPVTTATPAEASAVAIGAALPSAESATAS